MASREKSRPLFDRPIKNLSLTLVVEEGVATDLLEFTGAELGLDDGVDEEEREGVDIFLGFVERVERELGDPLNY